MGGTRVHASCVLVGEAGILIRGASGSGKSALAARLIDHVRRGGRFARLVCDDRVEIEAHHGRLLARAVPAIAGRLEVRGLGLVCVAHEPSAVVGLVVDCLETPAGRLPTGDETSVMLDGVRLPRMGMRLSEDAARTILLRLGDLNDTPIPR